MLSALRVFILFCVVALILGHTKMHVRNPSNFRRVYIILRTQTFVYYKTRHVMVHASLKGYFLVVEVFGDLQGDDIGIPLIGMRFL